jgi:hypothetical protein
MKPTFFKVYFGPSYPLDPAKEEKRLMEKSLDGFDFMEVSSNSMALGVLSTPDSISEIATKIVQGTLIEPLASQYIEACTIHTRHLFRNAVLQSNDFRGRLFAIEAKDRIIPPTPT